MLSSSVHPSCSLSLESTKACTILRGSGFFQIGHIDTICQIPIYKLGALLIVDELQTVWVEWMSLPLASNETLCRF